MILCFQAESDIQC